MATLLLICRETSKLGTGFDGAILGHKAFNGLSLKKPIQRFLDASKSWGWVVLGVRKKDGQDQKQQLYNNSNIMQHLGVFAVWSSSFGGGSISKNPSETDWIKPETCQVPAAWAAPGHQKASHHATSGLTQAWDMSAVPRISHDFTMKTCWRFHSLLQRLVDWDPIRPRTLGWMQNKACLGSPVKQCQKGCGAIPIWGKLTFAATSAKMPWKNPARRISTQPGAIWGLRLKVRPSNDTPLRLTVSPYM